MNISITFRHMASSEAIKSYTSDKLGKLQKFLRQPMTAKVTLSIDGLMQIAEARISSGHEHLEAKESSEDVYASIDKMMSKLERQITGAKGAMQAKRRGADSVRTETLSSMALVDGESAKEKPKPKAAPKVSSAKASATRKR